MTINRNLVQQAFPNQPQMQAAFEQLVADAEDATARLNAAVEAITGLAGGAEAFVEALAAKQDRSDTLTAVSILPTDPGALEQIEPGIMAVRPIDAEDKKSLLTRELADSRYLGAAHGAVGDLLASNNLSDVASKVTSRANLATGLGNYVDDTAAAAGGVSVGQWYRNGSVLMLRVA